MMANVPVGISIVEMKMRSEIAEIMPGTTAGRQASAKMIDRPRMPSATISMAIQVPSTVAASVVAAAIMIEYRQASRNCLSCITLAYQSSVQSPIGKATKLASLKLIAIISVSGRNR